MHCPGWGRSAIEHAAYAHSLQPLKNEATVLLQSPFPHNSDILLEGRPEKTGLQHLFTDLEGKKKFDAIAELIRSPKNS